MAINGQEKEIILGIDIGNTISHFGVIRGGEILDHWRVSSRERRTTDECWILLHRFLEGAGVRSPDAVVIASVVPRLTQAYLDLSRRRLEREPVLVTGELALGIKLCVDRPEEVGGDRIANSVAAVSIYDRDVIVVDLGTATTFDVVSAEKEYLGGVIAPGIETSASRLIERTAKLPEVEFLATDRVIGRNTEEAIRSGVFFGSVALIDGVVQRILSEWNRQAIIVATGGLAGMVASSSNTISDMDPFLTLKGLYFIHSYRDFPIP